jgi:hypothetical protein
MEYYTTELVLSVQEAIERAKATANTLKSPPRLYDGDSSSVHLWTDKPGRVKKCCYGEPDGGSYTIWSKMDCFILTLKVEPFIIELPISWKKRLKGWLRREKLQPETRFEGYYIIFVHNYWVEYLPIPEVLKIGIEENHDNIEILSPEERKDKKNEEMLQQLVERLEQSNNVSLEGLYKSKKDSLEKQLKSRRGEHPSLADIPEQAKYDKDIKHTVEGKP